MKRRWRWLAIPAYPLLAVNLIFALLYSLWAWPRAFAIRDGVLTAVARRLAFKPKGQGWSPLVMFSDEKQRQRPDLRVHEYDHVWQEVAWAYVGAAISVPLFVQGFNTLGTVVLFSGGPVFMLTYIGTIAVRYVPHVLRSYREAVTTVNMTRWSAIKFAVAQWRKPYEESIYEREAYALQAEYVFEMTPDDQAETWGHK